MLHLQCLLHNCIMLNSDNPNDLTWTWHVLICTDMRVQKWLWTVEWCWESACVTSLWQGRCSSLKISTASSVTWSSQPLTSPQTLSPHSKYASIFSFCFQHLHNSYLISCTLLFPLRISSQDTRLCVQISWKTIMTGWAFQCGFWSLNWRNAHVVPNILLKCQSGIYRVREAPAFWKLCHQTTVSEGKSSAALSNQNHC